MRSILYSLHSLVRRHISALERLLVALGMTALLYGALNSVPAYPPHWDGAMLATTFLLLLWSPPLGYFFAVAIAVYPLYTVSLYLAVLFLAVAIIGQHLFIPNLGATLLVMYTPLLGAIYLPWIVPLLGGLWWGPAAGLLMGLAGSLWGLLLATWVGLPPDWMSLWGILPAIEYVPVRFMGANSLQTLQRMFTPLAPDATTLLYVLLQSAGWGVIGWLVGILFQKDWAVRHRLRYGVLLMIAGATGLALLHRFWPFWLDIPVTPDRWEVLALVAISSAVAGIVLHLLEDFIEHPLPLPEPPAIPMPGRLTAFPTASEDPPLSQESQAQSPSPSKDDQDTLILLELD